MEEVWTLEEERQELINGIRFLDPGDGVYQERLRVLKDIDSLIPKETAKDKIELKKAEVELKKVEWELNELKFQEVLTREKAEVELGRERAELRKAETEACKAEEELAHDTGGRYGIRWRGIVETVVPIASGIVLTGLLEQLCGVIFTSKGVFFWRK